MYGSLSSRVIMPFPLIYIPLLSIVVIFYIPHQTHLFLCCCKGLHIVIYLDDILALVCSKWAGRRACLFCVPCWSVLVYTSFFPSQTFAFLYPLLFGVVLGYCPHVGILPPDNLADFQQLALSLLQTPYVTVCRVMSFLGKAKFYTTGQSHLLHLSCVIQNVILGVYLSPTQLFSCVHFSLSSFRPLEQLAILLQSPLHCNFHFLMWSLLLILLPLIGPFIFRDLGYLIS